MVESSGGVVSRVGGKLSIARLGAYRDGDTNSTLRQSPRKSVRCNRCQYDGSRVGRRSTGSRIGRLDESISSEV